MPETKNDDRECEVGVSSNENVPRNIQVKSQFEMESKAKSQPILKGDRLFTLDQPENWTLFGKRDNCVFATGLVILNKDQKLSVRWDNGKDELLETNSDCVGYTNRVFVADRESVYPGSRVSLVGRHELYGTVTAKKFLVSGSCIQHPEVVFDDVEASTLNRYTHGNGLKDVKVLYNGWLGVTSGYRAKLYLRATVDDCMFAVTKNDKYMESLGIGSEITIDLNVIWNAQWSDSSTIWITSLLHYYNTTAVIQKIEIQEIDVYWIGKVGKPADPCYEAIDLEDAPESTIENENFNDMQFIYGENERHISAKSLWQCKITPELKLISKDQWVYKWLKAVDWERWEYPVAKELQDVSKYMTKDLILQTNLCRSVVDVMWDNGTECTLNSADVTPVYVGSVWADTLRLQPGTVVENRLEPSTDRYGIIATVDADLNAGVKWITPTEARNANERNVASVELINIPLYNLVEKNGYGFMKMLDQFPLIYSEDRFQVGVMTGLNMKTLQVCVKLPNGAKESLWPHQLKHYKCDIMMCPVKRYWLSWYEHMVPPQPPMFFTSSKVSHFSDDVDGVSTDDFENSTVLSLLPKDTLEFVEIVPDDNIFVNEEMLPRLRETHYRRALENELTEMKENLGEGIWVEFYENRGDTLSAIVSGPKDTLYEDFMLVFDIFLMEDFPNSDPHLNIRSFGVSIFPNHFCKTGAMFLPQETRLSDKDFSMSYINNVLLEVKDFMRLPLETIIEIDHANDFGVTRYEDSEEVHKFLLLSLIDYAIASLRNSPKGWTSLLKSHYATALPRIIERYKTGPVPFKRSTVGICSEKGDDTNATVFQLEPIQWSETYKTSITARVEKLEQVLRDLSGIVEEPAMCSL